jgi:predicted amidohydrolase
MQERLQGVSTITGAIEKATKANLVGVAWTKLTKRLSWVPALLLYHNQKIASTYFTTFSQLAKEYNVYIAAGSVALPPYRINNGEVLWEKGPSENRVYNTSYLFGPDGKVIGKQQKVHLIDLEGKEALDLAQGFAVDKLRSVDRFDIKGSQRQRDGIIKQKCACPPK